MSKSENVHLVFDIDFLIFEAVSVAEDKYIIAKHIPTGKEYEFANTTELWGEWRKKVGGWIGTQNMLLGEGTYKAEDFEVEHKNRPRPFKLKGNPEEGTQDRFISPWEGAKKILDDKIVAIGLKLGAETYQAFTGRGETFRHDVATLMPYKGNREELVTPILLDEMKEYVVAEKNTEWVDGIEADDAVSMAVYEGYINWKAGKGPKVIGIAIDKDSKGCTGWWYNPSKDKEPRLIEGFGGLWLDDKGDVDGAGRMWLYYQVAAGDAADGYKSNACSDKKYGSKGAYNDLHGCTNDKEAFTTLVSIFKKLYPEKKTVVTFRGEIEIDAIYVMQEMFDLAHMQRWKDDRISVKSVLDKFRIEYA